MLRLIREVEPPRPSTRLSHSDELPNIAAKRKLVPAKLTKLVHGELDWIVMKALEKERSRRYETANSLAMEILRYLHHEPVLAGPPGAAYRLRKFVRRNRGPVAVTAIIALLVLGGIVGTAVGLVRALRAERGEKAANGQLSEALDTLRTEQRRTQEALLEAQTARAREEEKRQQVEKLLREADLNLY